MPELESDSENSEGEPKKIKMGDYRSVSFPKIVHAGKPITDGKLREEVDQYHMLEKMPNVVFSCRGKSIIKSKLYPDTFIAKGVAKGLDQDLIFTKEQAIEYAKAVIGMNQYDLESKLEELKELEEA